MRLLRSSRGSAVPCARARRLLVREEDGVRTAPPVPEPLAGEDMRRAAAALVVAIYFGVVVIAVTATATADDNIPPRGDVSDKHRRVVGTGQIRFDGAGPERWAARYRRERRTVTKLRLLLAARVDRVVGMVAAFDCVHGYEGAWNANTGNGYFGGLQFGASEWRRFGGNFAPRADLATPAQQIAAGIAYHAVAGFSPWHYTARRCGLIR
jgi:Transglycosylase-like domain